MTRLTPLYLVALVSAPVYAQDVNEANEAATKAAAAAVAPSVVKIETAGGREVVGASGGPGSRQAGVRIGVGPTTGLVVDKDGYVISSAFNFANRPTDIFVTVPGRPRLVAKVVATDTTRMLTLLKVDARDLPVPAAVPKKVIRVGQWALALGRALDPDVSHLPSVSAGVVSATNRIVGKMVQTDAKVSPVNYGGPLVAIDGRVIGVLVPAAPRGEGETAGVEWYDSGIGFAVPLEDVFAVLPRLKEGKDLRRGLLGVTPKDGEDRYGEVVVVGTVARGSAAEKSGVKAGDRITKIDGKPVAHVSQLMHALGPKYEGDKVTLVVLRDGKETEFKEVTLSGAVNAFAPPLLGILPMRDDPEPGVEVRHVLAKSPADAAGVKPGDRVLKFAPATVPMLPPVANRAQLAAMMTRVTTDTEVKVEVKRKDGGKTETFTIKLGVLPTDLLADKAPLPSSKGKAVAAAKGAPTAPKAGEPEVKPKPDEKPGGTGGDKADAETGLIRRQNKTSGRDLWLYVPDNYDPKVSHGVIVWFHAAGRGGKDAGDMKKIWGRFCAEHHFLIVGPQSKAAGGWLPSEMEEILPDVRGVLGEYTVDQSRVVAHGMGVGGQMAIYVAFHARDLVRGAAVSGSVLGTQPKDTTPDQPLSFFLVAGQKDPLLKEITEGKALLEQKKYPVVFREIADFGKEYLDEKTFDELARWMDSLDRI